MNPLSNVRAVCFDWGGTLMSERGGPEATPMALWDQVEVLEGAQSVLSRLHGKWPLAIATNASVSNRQMISLALHRVGLGPYFSAIFCFTELGCRKDQRAFWEAVEQGLNVPMNRVAMVGDSYEQDARAPRSFGVQAVWLNRQGETLVHRDAVPEIDRLERFGDWVEGSSDRS